MVEYYWRKGWRSFFYWTGWIFGVFSIAFWIILLSVWQGFAYDKPFINEKTDYTVYILGFIRFIIIGLGLLTLPFVL